MKMSERELWELNELASAAADGWLSERQQARLEEILAASDEARRQYLRVASVSAGVAWVAHAETPAIRHVVSRGYLGGQRHWGAWAAAAVLAIAATGVWFRSRPQQVNRQAPVVPGVAVLNDAYGVEWQDAQEPNHIGNVLKPGALKLKSGVAQIQFLNGANVWMQGPAELDLLSPNEGNCKSGKMLVDVPKDARGFRINAPWDALADPGSGFGVEVDHSQAAIHVFRGQVEISAQGDQRLPVDAGNAMMIEGNGSFHSIPADPQPFNQFYPPPPPVWGAPFGQSPWMGGFSQVPVNPLNGGPRHFGGYGQDPFSASWSNPLPPARWMGDDPLDSARATLHADNVRWNQIAADISAYFQAQSQAAGLGFPENEFARAQWDLWLTVGNGDSSDDELAKRLQAWRTARDSASGKLAQARGALVAKLTSFEQAELVASGFLQ